jgi:curli production assembly/transport component CsgG/holdfast attachment protein HfaB
VLNAVLVLAVTACASLDQPARVVEPIRGSAPQEITTDYTDALRCMGDHVRAQPYPAPRLAVGLITDMTGAQDYVQGRRLTQGATLMAITAAADAGMRLVERYDMGVVQVELDFARNGLLRDSEDVIREVRAGSIEGADLYIIGGITEYNPNIRSRGADAFSAGQSARGASLTLGGSDYVIDVGLDLRLIDARSSEVLAVRSLRKQIVGREIRAGVFGYVDGTMLDIGGGQRALEPVQTAVRTMIDRIVYEFVASLYSVSPDLCLQPEVASDGVNARGADILDVSMTQRVASSQLRNSSLLSAVPDARRQAGPKLSFAPEEKALIPDPDSPILQPAAGNASAPQARPLANGVTGSSALSLLRGRS